MAEFEWPDNLAEDVWGDLPSRFSISDVEEVLELVKPHIARQIEELQKQLSLEKLCNKFLRLNNKNVFAATQDYVVKLQMALAEVAPDHELLQGLSRELPEPIL